MISRRGNGVVDLWHAHYGGDGRLMFGRRMVIGVGWLLGDNTMSDDTGFVWELEVTRIMDSKEMRCGDEIRCLGLLDHGGFA